MSAKVDEVTVSLRSLVEAGDHGSTELGDLAHYLATLRCAPGGVYRQVLGGFQRRGSTVDTWGTSSTWSALTSPSRSHLQHHLRSTQVEEEEERTQGTVPWRTASRTSATCMRPPIHTHTPTPAPSYSCSADMYQDPSAGRVPGHPPPAPVSYHPPPVLQLGAQTDRGRRRAAVHHA
ncbi:hypothetical protein GBF38_002626 [Nibea albiflora]|uniref:Uncharacterized protein n=1 Tax=Nibea albiflora TaxID=240163 RepID=A0ACB7EED2_NIBAL|nr:hypothetical protein GBF38_002626 [Nibea albiflora]